jgi:hypothetical protein
MKKYVSLITEEERGNLPRPVSFSCYSDGRVRVEVYRRGGWRAINPGLRATAIRLLCERRSNA